MPYDHLSPTTGEDEAADRVVRRGRNVGATWIVASVVLLGLTLVAPTILTGTVALLGSVSLLALGVWMRRRYWSSARRQLGDATLQRAQWRSAADERGSQDRIMIAIAVVLVLLALQAWSR